VNVTYFLTNSQFLGTFAELPKATISLFLSVRAEKLSLYWMAFHEI
jgi:hypothetical protein